MFSLKKVQLLTKLLHHRKSIATNHQFNSFKGY
ncbi:MAG: hypothetical protein JWR12_2467 [Mucilaginibacter sp.]|nr:hypothetical protein [Mucilaginibacter sp.]